MEEGRLFTAVGSAVAEAGLAAARATPAGAGGAGASVNLRGSGGDLWERWRYLPIWKVAELVALEARNLRQRDEELRRRTTDRLGDVASTLSAVQSLPEHR